MTDPHALCAAMTRAVEALRWSMNEPDDAVRKAKAMEAVDEVRREMGDDDEADDCPPLTNAQLRALVDAMPLAPNPAWKHLPDVPPPPGGE